MKNFASTNTKRLILGSLALGVIGVCAMWLSYPGANASARPGMVYTSAGFGGYIPRETPMVAAKGDLRSTSPSPQAKPTPTDSSNSTTPTASVNTFEAGILKAAGDYQAGRYVDAEREAKQISSDAHGQNMDPLAGKSEARADLIVAYSEARQKNLQSAREWFWKVKDEASRLPDHGARKMRLGDIRPTLEEEAAFQHAVCTGALGERDQAETELKVIMKDYPESPMVHAAVKRIARFHGGDVPKDSEAIWQAAMKEARRREDARQALISRCGPECLAELIDPKRNSAGHKALVRVLAQEMHTDKDGTSVDAFVKAATKRSIPARGLELTFNGLLRQKLPMVALLSPGHYVLIKSADTKSVTYWDPYLDGPSKPGTRKSTLAEWEKRWTGLGVALQ